METNSLGNELMPAEPAKKTWKDYIGWAGFVVTTGILLEQAGMHGAALWDLFFSPGSQFLSIFTSPDYTSLHWWIVVFFILQDFIFTLYPAFLLVLMVLRKMAVPGLLVIFAAVAFFTNTVAELLDHLNAAESGFAMDVNLGTVVYLAIDVTLVLFYSKSKRFKALFVK